MVRRTRLGDSTCPVARTLDVIGDWWSLLIVRAALDGDRRFSEFHRTLGVARNILTTRLRALVDAEILMIVPAPGGGAHHEYALTPRGESLRPVIAALRQWGEENLPAAPDQARGPGPADAPSSTRPQ
ncbi:winged helix-turn-helix transcriptional regulator [Nonomuraea sp. CA-143628]|uniref:winged helix-turn-helix transcriptional regulator n=1 Tax=Nonomuraea sp. CA-143628 TaxID=3239997 RepID=UPI003D933B51